MPTYRITAPDGRTIRLTGDTPPTESELEDIFLRVRQDAPGQQEAPSIDPHAGKSGIWQGAAAPSQFTEPFRGLQRGIIGAEIAGQTMMAASQGDRLRTLAESIRAKSGFQQQDSLSPVFGNQQTPTPQPKSAADIATLTAQQDAVQKLEESIGQRAIKIASLQAERDAVPKSEAMQGFDDPENWWKAWLANPVEVTATLMTENLPQMVPGMVAGAAAGSALGPIGTAIGAGSGSLAVEYANGIIDALDEEGVDVRNAGALTEAFLDPAKMAAAKARALKGGIPVAAWDAVSGGVAGRFVRPVIGKGLGPVVRRSLAEAAAQGAMGGAGEISKAIALDKPINWRDVAAEVVLELPGGAVEVATNIREDLDGRTRQKAAAEHQKAPNLPETAAGGTGGMIPVGPVKEPEQPQQPPPAPPTQPGDPGTRVRFQTADGKAGELTLPPGSDPQPALEMLKRTQPGHKISSIETVAPKEVIEDEGQTQEQDQEGQVLGTDEGAVKPTADATDVGAATEVAEPTDASPSAMSQQEQDAARDELDAEMGKLGTLVDDLRRDITERGDTNRPGDEWRRRFKSATDEELVEVISFTRGEDATPWVKRFVGDWAAQELRTRGVPVDTIEWQSANARQDAARAELDQELGQTDEQPATPEPEPAAQPQPASPEQVKPEPFKKNAIVWVGFRKNGRHIHKAKVNAVDGEFVTVYLFKKKQYVTLPAGQVSLPASVQGRKNYEAQFAGMSPDERKRAKADSKAFDDLVRNEGWRFDWYDPRVEQGTGAKEEELRQAAALQAARRKAFAALGVANLAPNDPVERAKLLPKLRQYVEQSIPEAERQQADFRSATAAGGQEVSASELAVGDMLDIEGEQVAVTAVDPDTGDVTLQDGRRFGTQTLADGDSIWIEKLDKPSASPDEAFRLTDTRKPITTPANERQRTIQDAAIVSWAKDKLGAIARGMRPARVPGNRVGAGSVPQSGARSGVPAGSGPGLLRALEQVFGVRIVLVESEDGRPLPFHGVVPERGRRVILIDANLDKPLPTIAGHEILHTIRSADPKLYADLVDALREMMPGAPDYKAKLDAVRKRYGMQPSTLDLAEEELVADFLGDSLTDPAFWSQLEQQDRGLFRRVAQAVKRWLDAIAQKVAGLTDYNSRQYFSDIERARRVLADAVKQYASNVAAGRYGDADTFVASNATITKPSLFSIRAYHGTPHKVDKFTTAKIGTGEGAQVYGWGLYFAQEKKVAEEYSKNLGKEILLDGKPIFSTSSKAYIHNGLGSVAMSALLSSNGDVDAAILEVKRDYPTDLKPVRQLEGVRGRISVNASGRTYTVNLNVEDDELLDWDKPLSEQGEKVRGAIERWMVESRGEDDGWFEESQQLSGSGVYRLLSSGGATAGDSARKASDRLASLGIRGIRYLDQGSRQRFVVRDHSGTVRLRTSSRWQADLEAANGLVDGDTKWTVTEEQGTHNFVIFDESAIEIVAENGQAITPTAAFSLRDADAELTRLRRKQNRTAADNARITELQAQLGQQDLFAVPTKPVAEIEREKQRRDVADGAARRLVADPLVTQKEMFGKPGQQELFSLRDLGGHLVAIHNTTAEKIRHMLKMGGLAVPSVAVARTDKGFASFGDISMVAPPHLVTPSSTTKVLNADAYSPRYPTVNYRLDAPSERKVGAFIKSKLDALPADKRKSFSHYSALEKVESEGIRNAMLDSESVKAAFLADTGRISSVEWDPVPHGSERYASSYDRTSIIKAVSRIEAEFEQWVDDTIGKLDVRQQERIFNGYTNGGDRRYLKHDLDTVVRIMKKGFRDAEGFNYGVGSVRANVAKKFRSLADIKGNRDKIVTSQEMDATKRAVDAEFVAMSEKALPLRTGVKNDGFGALDAFSDDLKALAEGGEKNMRYLRQMYPEAQPFEEMRAFLAKLRDLPSHYFEAKVQRAVQMSEFIGAAVPDGTAKDIITELQRFGLKVKTYPKGDETARMQAVQEIGDEGNALFSLRNEQARRDQAGNLDTPLAARWIAGGLRILQSLPAGSMFSAWKGPFLAEFPDAKPWVNQTWTRVRQAEAQEARFSLSPLDDRGTTPPVKAGDPAGQSSQSATPQPGQGVVTPQLEAAYKMGLEEGAKWGRSLQKFDAFANQGEAEYPPFFDVLADPRALFWQAGFVGSGVPKWVRAFRIGKLPTDGTSTNFRDGHREKGVSVLYIEGEKRSDVGTFDLFNPGDLVAVEGWRHYETGSDGEPLLVGAVPSQQSFSLRDPSDGSQFSLSGDAQAAVNRIEAEASHASEAAKAAAEPPPVYDPERVTRWWHHLLRPSDVITIFGADGLLKKKHGLELATAYQAAAVKKERDNLREQLEDSLYAADPKLKTWPKWARWIWPKTRLREFMQIALPTAAHMQVVDGEPGDWEFADFEMRAGTLSEAAAKKMGASPGSTINTANPITGVAETLVVGSLIDLENGRKVYQLFRPMKAETQRQVYDYVRAKYPEFTWLIDLWVTPRMKDARVTINGVEIPIFNRFSLAAKYSEGDPTFQWRQAYTPDVALSSGIIGSVRRFVQRKRLNLRAGVESPGRKYETGAARESGNVMDLLSGWSTRTFQVLQEQERKTWMQEVLGTAADIPNQSRIEDVPDGWMVIDDAMNALWRAFQGLRKTDRSAFPQTADRLADDNSPEYQAFFGEVMRLRGKPKMLPEILVKSLIGRMSAQEEHGRLMKLAQWWGRNWKAALLLMPDTWIENRTDNYLRLIMAGHRQLTAAILSGGDKLAFREARNLAWAGLANLIPGVRQAFRLNHQSLFKRVVEERLPEDVFGGNTRLRDLQLLERGTRDEIRSLLDQGKKARAVGKVVAEAGPMALEAVGYGNLDIAGKQQFAFSTLLAKAQTLARRKGLRGEDMSRFVEEWMSTAPDAEVRRAVEGANRWLLNYGDTPNWVHTLARHPVSNLLVAFPLFRYHFVGREIDRATAALRGLHKSLILGKKLTKAEKVAAWADTISYVTMPAMGYAVASVIGALKDSVIAPALEGLGGDDDEDPRAVVGSSVQLVEDDGKLVRKPLPRDLVTANRLNISHLLRSFGMETGGDSDYWWHFKDYPIVRSAAAFYQAAEDAKKHGFKQGIITMQGMMMEMLSSLSGTGQAVKVPAKVLAEIESASSGRPGFTQWDPYATGVSLPAYLTLQALNLVPFQRQANEVLKWVDPTPRRVRSSKTLNYDAGALEALQAEGWTGLMDRMLRGGESTLPPQGTIDRRSRMVLTPRQHTLAERIAGLMGQNVKTVDRNRYRNAIED